MGAALSLFELDVLDCESVDICEESVQYNEAVFFIKSLQKYNGKCIEVKHNWKFVIWSDEGQIIDEFFLIENDEFRQKLYERYPLAK
ncbi:hypothetical protein Elgi_37700 [Paenibacillus elgii]|uniref:hypothetical protein n=1 Tax=Paenibacillus elgii TaxID=189691 RepID=UPI002D7D6E97|nr:hypothetical protein Elgi_37700 [Paenibacillus elgii]